MIPPPPSLSSEPPDSSGDGPGGCSINTSNVNPPDDPLDCDEDEPLLLELLCAEDDELMLELFCEEEPEEPDEALL